MTDVKTRMTWEEIEERYPDQWVGLVDVEQDNASTVKSAVVKYSDKTKNELVGLHRHASDYDEPRFTKPVLLFRW